MVRPGELTERLGSLGPREVLVVGEFPAGALSAWPEAITRTVVVTGERRAHYLERHPEMAEFEAVLGDLLGDPDEVHRYRGRKQVANVYRRIDNDYYWMVGVAVATVEGLRNSVLSFRRARRKEVERGRGLGLAVWTK